jgi:hypothetical protein
MTTKENLLIAVLKEKNALAEEKNSETIDIDTYSKTCKFRKEAKESTVYELQAERERLHAFRGVYNREQKVKEYYATPEGQAIRQRLKAKEKELKSEYESLRKDVTEKLKKELSNSTDESWDIEFISADFLSMKIARKDSKGEFIFGQSVDINLRKGNALSEDKLDFNIGTMGGFNVLAKGQSEMVNFYVGIGCILSDPYYKIDIANLMWIFNGRYEILKGRMKRLEYEIEFPY